MISSKIYLAVGVLAGSAAAIWLLHATAAAKSREREILFEQQERQLAELTSKQQQRSAAVEGGSRVATEDPALEIAKLRAEAEALRRQTNELIRKKSSQAPAANQNAGENRSPEYLAALRLAAGNREYETHKLATAFLLYAVNHNGQVASNIDSVAAELDKVTKDIGQSPVSNTSQFDMVFHGSLSDLDGVPTSNVAVLRQRETWTAPDGRTARV